MLSLFRKSLTNTLVKWPDIPMYLKVYSPADWEIQSPDPSLKNIKFQAQKNIGENTSLFMLISGQKYEHDFSEESITSLTKASELEVSTAKMGLYLCSQTIKIWEVKGSWVLHKTAYKDMIGYRITYILYYWKYCYSLIYGSVSDKDGVGLSLYKENDELFYDLAVKTKFKWVKGS